MKERIREKEHAFVTIERDLKEGNIPSVVLLCGREEYLVKWYEAVLVKRFVSESSRALDLTVLEEGDATVRRIAESLETVSLMSERKVVVIPDFAPAAGKAMRGFSETTQKSLRNISRMYREKAFS